MTTRPVEDVEVDIKEAESRIQMWTSRLIELKQELAARRVADAEAAPHPWLGKRVKRSDRQRITGWSGRTTGYRDVTFRGIVAIRSEEHRFLSGAGYHKPGDTIVLSLTGKKIFSSLHDRSGWELDEEEGQ